VPIPLNRVVAFVGPYLSVVSGGFASWLVARANVLGIGGLDKSNIATQVAGGLTFVVVAALTWLGHSKWLTGHQIGLRNEALLASAALTSASSGPQTGSPPAADADIVAQAVVDEGLPTDAEEEAAPPGSSVPPATAEDIRPRMPSEVPLEHEPDEVDGQ
jgi:hypothetical protein